MNQDEKINFTNSNSKKYLFIEYNENTNEGL